jgi:hypothetical protein
MKGNIMEMHEKFAGVFFMTLLLGMGGLVFYHVSSKNECTKTALTSNYTPEQIRTICR